MSLKLALFVALGAVTVWFLWAWWRLAQKSAPDVPSERAHTWYHTAVGFVMCFFDTLGIGNFATTTSAFKFRGSVPDEKIPGTLNVAYALPTVVQAYIYISAVRVDIVTVVLMIIASVAGAWLGAGIVSHWPRRKIQIGMGCALLAACGIILMQIVATQERVSGWLAATLPASEGLVREVKALFAGGAAEGLVGIRLVVGLAGNFVLGALMTLGIGLYAPCLMLVSLLGMNPAAGFPIMMGSCAFLMPVASMKFIRAGRYVLRTSLVLALSGIPAVLIAAFIVRSLSVDNVRWLVAFVVLYAATMMLRSAWKERAPAVTPQQGEKLATE